MMPDLEQMILDLEGRGWRIFNCFWSGQNYFVALEQADREEEYLVESDTFKGAITEAWRHCK